MFALEDDSLYAARSVDTCDDEFVEVRADAGSRVLVEQVAEGRRVDLEAPPSGAFPETEHVRGAPEIGSCGTFPDGVCVTGVSAAIRVEHGVDRLIAECHEQSRSRSDGVAGRADEVDRHAIHRPVDLTVGRCAQVEAFICVTTEIGERVSAGQDRLHLGETLDRCGIEIRQVSLGEQ